MLSKVFGSRAYSPFLFTPLTAASPSLQPQLCELTDGPMPTGFHPIGCVVKGAWARHSLEVPLLLCSLNHSHMLWSEGTGWDRHRNRPTPLSDAPSKTFFTSQGEFSEWKVIFFIPRILFYNIHMHYTHESEPHFSLDQHLGPRGADVCSGRGTWCFHLGQ